MKKATNKHGIDYIITATNEDNDRQIEQMVGKAMCAYANWQEVDYIPYLANGYDRAEAKGRFEAEYEATVRCIAMFVDQPTSCICNYVIARAEEKFGI